MYPLARDSGWRCEIRSFSSTPVVIEDLELLLHPDNNNRAGSMFKQVMGNRLRVITRLNLDQPLLDDVPK